MSKRLKSGVKLEQAKLCVVKVFYRSDCCCECLGLRATVMLLVALGGALVANTVSLACADGLVS